MAETNGSPSLRLSASVLVPLIALVGSLIAQFIWFGQKVGEIQTMASVNGDRITAIERQGSPGLQSVRVEMNGLERRVESLEISFGRDAQNLLVRTGIIEALIAEEQKRLVDLTGRLETLDHSFRERDDVIRQQLESLHRLLDSMRGKG